MRNWIFHGKAMKGTHHWTTPCHLCGQWILEDEEFYLLGIPNELRHTFDIKNFIAHKEEWEKFCQDLSDEEILNKLINHKKPRKKPLNKEQLHNIECFKNACEAYSFNKYTLSKDRRFVKMKKRNTSSTIIYDIIFDRIRYETRANEGLFGGLHSNQLVANISNKYYELKGLDKRDDYSASNIIKQAIEDVNEMMSHK